MRILYDITNVGFRFFTDGITDMSNDINEEMDLSGKSKHFLMEPCEGENHSGGHLFARVLIERLMNGGNASIEVSFNCRIRKVIY